MKGIKLSLVALVCLNTLGFAAPAMPNNQPNQVQLNPQPQTVNNSAGFEETLKLLQEKEDLDAKNKILQQRIDSLEGASSANENKYQTLLKHFNELKESEKDTKLEMNQLLKEEKQNRLPIPFLIVNNGQKAYAHVLKLNWYYSYNAENKPSFNGYYVREIINLNETLLNHKVTSFTKNGIVYCELDNTELCDEKKMISQSMAKELLELKIVDGVPNQMLDKNNELTPFVTQLLKENHPITKHFNEEQAQSGNQGLDEMGNPINGMMNPGMVNGQPTGQDIPRNNIPNMNEQIQNGGATPPQPVMNTPQQIQPPINQQNPNSRKQ